MSALPSAVAFTIALNWLLLTTFVYTDWMSGILVRMSCWIGVAAWLFYVIRRCRELPLLLTPREVSDEPDRFGEAQVAFLKGDWEEAEAMLQHVLAIEPRDPPALILLAGVFRHTERLEAAEMLVQEIRRLEIAEEWDLEVTAEANRLQRAKEVLAAETTSQPACEPADPSGAADLTAA